MEKFIDICGNPIELKGIKQFRIVQREYIFRPVYREHLVKNKGIFSKEQKQIEFACMKQTFRRTDCAGNRNNPGS